MAKTTLNTVQSQQKRWEADTADYFTLRLDGGYSILIALCANIDEYEKEDGRATDEAIVLAIQHVVSVIYGLEKLSYELDDAKDGIGELSLQLMWARALLEIIEGMFNANSWKINLGKGVLIGYLGAVERILRKASDEAAQVHVRRFSAAPVIAAAKR
jgi:hypothetical protein